MDAESIIQNFGLEPLPHEGGWFRRIYTDDAQIPSGVKGPPGALSSMIYYLITAEGYSAMHRLIRSTETFHWHAGDPMEQLLLYPDGSGEKITLGNDFDCGHAPMSIVPRGVWQGARLSDDTAYYGFAFMSVVVTPEFIWDDFALGDPDTLVEEYPEWRDAILKLSR
ncbi:cupin domain-containing protein [Cerasicoccus frondis]|uniref:cupin domain-containing protein n=1 Tax=Cerasicoccus frondis TaxID=490090 RepID=UPI00285274F6|nr:cupin domain-containing protein [Cerasicoccus frondis]